MKINSSSFYLQLKIKHFSCLLTSFSLICFWISPHKSKIFRIFSDETKLLQQFWTFFWWSWMSLLPLLTLLWNLFLKSFSLLHYHTSTLLGRMQSGLTNMDPIICIASGTTRSHRQSNSVFWVLPRWIWSGWCICLCTFYHFWRNCSFFD